MHIEELYLQNFRGFKELNLKFPSKLAVLIGVNGSGKSSILDSLSMLLTNSFFKIIEELETSQLRVREGNSEDKSAMAQYPKLGERDVNTLAQKGVIKTQLVYGTSITQLIEEFHVRRFYNINRDALVGLIYQKLIADKNTNIPIFLHLRANRFTTANIYQETFKTSFIPFPQLSAYLDCTSINQNDFTTFFQWFRNQEDIENEERLEVNPEYRDKQLEAVKKAITSLLGDDYTNLRVKRTSSQMIVHKKREELSISQLSDGEKGLLAMIGDIARRLAIANPSLENPLEGEGVILIDEIELHLHPQWQRKIIPNLTNTFPNCQFIVTTHSPQVLSNVKKEDVFILEDFKLVEHTPYTYGRDSNSILFEIFGVNKRPDETDTQELIDKCFRLIDAGEVEKVKEELKKLSDSIGEDDAAVVELNALTFFQSINSLNEENTEKSN